MVRPTVAAALFAAAASLTIQAQVLTERNVSLQLAVNIANAAMAACKADGYDVSAAVVDRAGDLKVLLRADTANPHNADLARRKAYTSRTFKVPSMDVAKRTNGATDLMLMLGDNAYNSGTDSEHQAAIFDMYPTILRNKWRDRLRAAAVRPAVVGGDQFPEPADDSDPAEVLGREEYQRLLVARAMQLM